MTVAPRYADYPGVFDTGLLAPVELAAGLAVADEPLTLTPAAPAAGAAAPADAAPPAAAPAPTGAPPATAGLPMSPPPLSATPGAPARPPRSGGVAGAAAAAGPERRRPERGDAADAELTAAATSGGETGPAAAAAAAVATAAEAEAEAAPAAAVPGVGGGGGVGPLPHPASVSASEATTGGAASAAALPPAAAPAAALGLGAVGCKESVGAGAGGNAGAGGGLAPAVRAGALAGAAQLPAPPDPPPARSPLPPRQLDTPQMVPHPSKPTAAVSRSDAPSPSGAGADTDAAASQGEAHLGLAGASTGAAGSPTYPSASVRAPAALLAAPQPAPPAPAPGATAVSYVRLYACQERGVTRVFVDHPIFRSGGGGGAGQAAADPVLAALSGAADPSAWPSPSSSVLPDPSLGVYTYSEAAGDGSDLQARNNVLCQAALAAPVLLWQDMGPGLPRDLQDDLIDVEGDPLPLPRQALPYVVHNGLAAPAITLEPGGSEALAAALRLRAAALAARRRERLREAPVGDAALEGGAVATRQAAGRGADVCSGAGDAKTRLRVAAASVPGSSTNAAADLGADGGGNGVHGRSASGAARTAGSQPQRRRVQQGELRQAHGGPKALQPGVIFVGNDWPTAVLPLWLEAYRDVAKASSDPNASGAAGAAGAGSADASPWRDAPPVIGTPSGGSNGSRPASAPAPAAGLRAAGEGEGGALNPAGGHVIDVGASAAAARAPPPAASEPAVPEVHSRDGHARHGDSGGGSGAEGGDRSSATGSTEGADVLAVGGNGGSSTATVSPLAPDGPGIAAANVAVQVAREAEVQEALLRQLFRAVQGLNPAAAAAAALTAVMQPRSYPLPQQLPSAATADDGEAAEDSSGSEAAAVPEMPTEPSLPLSPSPQPQPPGEEPPARPASPEGPRDPQRRLRATLRAFRRFVSGQLGGSRVVFALHNPAYQGLFPEESFSRLGLPPSAKRTMLLRPTGSESAAAGPEPGAADNTAAAAAGGSEATPAAAAAEAAGAPAVDPSSGGMVSWLKAAVTSSDRLVTVSPAFARQLAAAAPRTGAKDAVDPAPTSAAGAGSASQAAAAVSLAEDLLAAPPGTGGGGSSGTGGVDGLGLPAGSSGAELAALLAARRPVGIMNGLDAAAWDPAADPMLPPHLRYDALSAAAGKAAAKAALQEALGLEADPEAVLFCFVGRLEAQKGADVVLAALPALLGPPAAGFSGNRSLGHDAAAAARAAAQAAREAAALRALPRHVLRALRLLRRGLFGPRWLAKMPAEAEAEARDAKTAKEGATPQGGAAAEPKRQADADAADTSPGAGASSGAGVEAGEVVRPRRLQFVLLGSGAAWLQECLASLRSAYPGRAAGLVGFNEPAARLLLAGADFLMVPSRWEPCGLVALAGRRYGAVPLVAPVAGLLDAVQPPLQPAAPVAAAAAAAATRNGSVEGPRGRGAGGDARSQEGGGGGGPLGLVMDAPLGAADDSAAKRAAVAALVRAVQRASAMYGSEEYNGLRRRCMEADASWGGGPAAAWEALLLEAAAADAGNAAARAGGGGGAV